MKAKWATDVGRELAQQTMKGALRSLISVFLGAFAKLRKAPVSFFMSVRPHGTTRLPLDGFAWNLTEYFSKISWEISKFHYSLTRITGTLHDELCTFTIMSRSVLVRMGYVSGKSYRGNQNTHLMLNNYFCFLFENRAVYEKMRKNIVEQGRPHMRVWDVCIACWIPEATNTLSYCFCTAAIVARTLLIFTLHVDFLPCWFRVRCL